LQQEKITEIMTNLQHVDYKGVKNLHRASFYDTISALVGSLACNKLSRFDAVFYCQKQQELTC